jgi:hypothetical protein
MKYPKINKVYTDLIGIQYAIKNSSNSKKLQSLIEKENDLKYNLLLTVAEETKDINPCLKQDVESGMINFSSKIRDWIERVFINKD